MKYKILTTILVVGLVSLAIGWGTFAYFSDTETSSGNQISAGTLNMWISKDNVNWVDGSPVTSALSSPAGGLAPGDEFTTGTIYLKNVGTIPVWWVYLHFYNFVVGDGAHPESEPNGADDYITNQIILEAITEYPNYDGPGGIMTTDFTNAVNANGYLSAWGATQDGSISLADIRDYAEPGGSSPNVSFNQHTGDSDNPSTPAADSYAYTVPYVPAGATAWIQFKFKLLENTNNYAQGDFVSFSVDFIGTQTVPPAQMP